MYDNHLYANSACLFLGVYPNGGMMAIVSLGAIYEMAGRGNGEHCEWIVIDDVMKQLTKLHER